MKRLELGRFAAVVVAAALAAGLAACGASSGSGESSGAGGSVEAKLYTDVPSSGCGSQPAPAAIDPDGIVATLPKAQQAAYKSFPDPNLKSAWSDFKPDHGPPYKVGLNLVPSVNDYMSRINTQLVKSLKEYPQVGDVVSKTSTSVTDVVGQLANFDGLLREDVDIIITVAVQPNAMTAPLARAAKQGVPVVSFLNAIPDKNSLNVQYNIYESAAASTATMMRLLDGKGNVIWMNGIPGDAVTDIGRQAFDATIKRCPGIKNLGQIFGTYQNPTAKRETLKFLATHPQAIAGVGQAGSMGSGLMQAFEQSGRDMPIVQDAGAQEGSMGYWRHHADYPGTGFGIPPTPTARTAVNVALRTLQGQGPKLNNLINYGPPITPANLDQWAEESWTLQSPGTSEGPELEFMDDQYLNTLFNSGKAPK